MKPLSFGILVVQFYMLHACEKYCFVQEQDKEFKGHVITTMTTPFVEVCWAKCVWIMNCFSINVRNTSFGTVKCDLNNSSKKAIPGSLVPTQGSQYHQFGEISGCDNADTECRLKEKLPDGWYRLGNSSLKMFYQNKTWNDSRTHCQSLGGDLLSIATEYENLFVKDIFKNKDDQFPNMSRYWPLDGSDHGVNLIGTAKYEILAGENAVYFFKPMGYAEVPAAEFNPEGFTFMLWFKLANLSSLVDGLYGDWYHPRTFVLRIHQLYKSIFVWLSDVDGKALPSYYVGFPMEDWNHIAVVWNNTEKNIKVVLNGTIKNVETFPSTTGLKRSTHNIWHLGVKSDSLPSTDRAFHGYMKHLMVFDKSLTVEEIQSAMYYNEHSPWIGLSAQNSTNTFKWSDGSINKFTTIPSYQPSLTLSGRKCVSFGMDGKWLGKFCNETYYYICEKPYFES